MFTRDVYIDDKAPAYVLLAVTLRKYGLDILDEDSELLRHEIDKDYSISISDLNNDKLQAAIAVLSTNHFETDWRVFEFLCHLFNNEPVEHDIFFPLEAEEIAVSLAEVYLIKNDVLDEKERIIYDDDVRAYAGKLFYDYGFSKPPRLFPTAIIPSNAVKSDDKEKNMALDELFDAHLNYTLDYYEKVN